MVAPAVMQIMVSLDLQPAPAYSKVCSIGSRIAAQLVADQH